MCVTAAGSTFGGWGVVAGVAVGCRMPCARGVAYFWPLIYFCWPWAFSLVRISDTDTGASRALQIQCTHSHIQPHLALPPTRPTPHSPLLASSRFTASQLRRLNMENLEKLEPEDAVDDDDAAACVAAPPPLAPLVPA